MGARPSHCFRSSAAAQPGPHGHGLAYRLDLLGRAPMGERPSHCFRSSAAAQPGPHGHGLAYPLGLLATADRAHDRRWVDHVAADPNLDVQMRAGREPGRPDDTQA
jgi:hypothetical protein